MYKGKQNYRQNENGGQREAAKVDNSSYRERFQFVLSVNDYIICQRYFRINGFNNESVNSIELKETMDDVVELIKNELVSKSRIFSWYTREEPIKLIGFANPEEKVLFTYPEGVEESNYADNERLEPWEVTFKFVFMMDNKPIYQYIWDGTDYPKYVRNSVDLTNSDSAYRDKEPMSLHFSLAIIRNMTLGRQDLVYTIIQKICETVSGDFDSDTYTKTVEYGGSEYVLSSYDRKYVNGWRKALEDKTYEYQRSLYPPSQKQLDYIDKYL